ncbi:Mu transposase C-terminal domain-containing protein [Pseudomonas chlororaphis]|uniref:Mu transposase C-terminal domain-containing protein n=1 Tax=Pseudomonas chlororaphis TaxID=587753 RepID=UPI001360B64A|nr:Mu transposase C-terminal domain-containing protein [Pseudomonas chlororaphis]
MNNELEIGALIVANGRLATVKQILKNGFISVAFRSSGEAAVVDGRHIETIENTESPPHSVAGYTSIVEGCSDTELSTAGRRFDTIRRWNSGAITRAEAANELNISEHHLYKIAKAFDDEIGSLSLLQSKRGRKRGTTQLSEEVERIITLSTNNIYKTRAASYRSVWRDVDIECHKQGLPTPSKKTVTRRIKLLKSEKERDKIKLGVDAANQKHAPRPGKKIVTRPLQWVQMDHTLVDIHLLANDRIHVIGRPWLTVAIDEYSRIILGYYLSLYVPSTVSVACALTHAILPKDNFIKRLALERDSYPYYGTPSVIFMDNATEFTSPKFISGCDVLKIETAYRPIGKKHYGGTVERLIGTFMTSKVHFLPGTTMSNAVARRGLDSEKSATMTFSEFASWFAQEVLIYHSTVHETLKASPSQVWRNFFLKANGSPFPPRISDPIQLKLIFMPERLRVIRPTGIELHGQVYWDPVLIPFLGTRNVVVKFDPYTPGSVWVKLEGEFYMIGLSDLTKEVPDYEEYRASRLCTTPLKLGAIVDDVGRRAYTRSQGIVETSRQLTKKERRRIAAQGAYLDNAHQDSPKSIITQSAPPDYSQKPKRFTAED